MKNPLYKTAALIAALAVCIAGFSALFIQEGEIVLLGEEDSAVIAEPSREEALEPAAERESEAMEETEPRTEDATEGTTTARESDVTPVIAHVPEVMANGEAVAAGESAVTGDGEGLEGYMGSTLINRDSDKIDGLLMRHNDNLKGELQFSDFSGFVLTRNGQAIPISFTGEFGASVDIANEGEYTYFLKLSEPITEPGEYVLTYDLLGVQCTAKLSL
jgi:hypothetical protein